MKKWIGIGLLLLMSVLVGCSGTQEPNGSCTHDWQEATCTEARTCTLCGKKEGEPSGHDYMAWRPNGDKTHSRNCSRDESHIETAPCFDGATPQDGQTCDVCGYHYQAAHSHSYDQKVEQDTYKAKAATCTKGEAYYYSCTCGSAGTELFYVGKALGHKEVVDPAKHATFSVAGKTEGAHCTVCGTVTKKQVVIPALGDDMVVGTDYYDKVGQTTYRYSYSFSLQKNDRFHLTTLKVGSDKSYELLGEEGALRYLDNGVYELVFDNKKAPMYGKFEKDQFFFCNKDGSQWKEQEKRPHGVTEVEIAPRPGNSVYGYKDFVHNVHGKSMQELYYRLYAAGEAFMDNHKSVAKTGKKYIIDRVNLEYYVLTAEEAVAVWKVFLIENPRYYWLSNTVSITDGVLEICIDPAYADGQYRQSCDKAIDSLVEKCGEKLTSGMGQLEKAKAIHDFILEEMNYAYKKDGVTPQDAIWAHNIIGCAEKKLGVCESYAKTYQYLCRIFGLDCITATGQNGEEHMWNITKINGVWYGVDCTFDETNKKELSYNCFGMCASRMESEYVTQTPQDSGVNYLYQLPTLSKQDIELVDLYKNGKFVGLYGSIDAAFEKMTDKNAEYEVRLFDYARRGPLLLSQSAIEHHVFATKTPQVKALTIRGKFEITENGIVLFSRLFIEKTLALQCPMSLYGLDIYGGGALDLKSQTLTCLGEHLQISVPITGSTDASNPSELYANDVKKLTIYGSVRVHTFRQSENSDETVFRNNTYIVKAIMSKTVNFSYFEEKFTAQIEEAICGGFFHLSGPVTVNIKKATGKTSDHYLNFRIIFDKVENIGKLTVGSSNVRVNLNLEGVDRVEVTDMDGNVVDSWEKAVDPKDIKGPVATIMDKATWDQTVVYFLDEKGRQTDHTSEYTRNAKNQVVLR